MKIADNLGEEWWDPSLTLQQQKQEALVEALVEILVVEALVEALVESPEAGIRQIVTVAGSEIQVGSFNAHRLSFPRWGFRQMATKTVCYDQATESKRIPMNIFFFATAPSVNLPGPDLPPKIFGAQFATNNFSGAQFAATEIFRGPICRGPNCLKKLLGSQSAGAQFA